MKTSTSGNNFVKDSSLVGTFVLTFSRNKVIDSITLFMTHLGDGTNCVC